MNQLLLYFLLFFFLYYSFTHVLPMSTVAVRLRPFQVIIWAFYLPFNVGDKTDNIVRGKLMPSTGPMLQSLGVWGLA